MHDLYPKKGKNLIKLIIYSVLLAHTNYDYYFFFKNLIYKKLLLGPFNEINPLKFCHKQPSVKKLIFFFLNGTCLKLKLFYIIAKEFFYFFIF